MGDTAFDRSRIMCSLALGAVLLITPTLGALAWSRSTELLAAPSLTPDAAVLAVLAAVGAVASSRLALGILLELLRSALRSRRRPWSVPTPAPTGPSTVARRLVAGALGAGLLTSVSLPAHAVSDWDPGWQPSQALPTAAPATRSAHPVPDDADAPSSTSTRDQESSVVVRPGDSLWRIAAGHLDQGAAAAEIAASWPEWYATNRAVIGRDPNLIQVGQVLAAPAVDGAES